MQLVLNKRGIKFTIESGIFEIRANDELQKVPAAKVKSIILHKSALVSTDVLLHAIEHGIDVIIMQMTGKPAGRIWSHQYGSISKIRKNQVQFCQSSEGAGWIMDLIMEKIKNQSALLYTLSKPDTSTDHLINNAIDKMNKIIVKIASLKYENISDISDKLRSFEGNSSRIYFGIINEHLPEQYRFEKRSQHPAFDMFNALLNYAYGMLYGKIEGALIQAGIDPYLGVMHRDEHNRPVLVFDIIEKFRVWADYVVIDLCMQQVIFSDFFHVENSVFYLDEHGKRILIQTMNDYLNDVVKMEGVERTREQQILIFAQKLATRLKKL
ncbi:MAG: CRISPR-associated endonuclease Cas1 [Bacteroidales bacterium]|nr:CRISPR-associated endonuclease Cas1 [Bacteroidales bacterium]